MDFNHDSHSSIFHMDQTKVMDGTMVRILTWYDNEWGFSNRMSDTACGDGQADLKRLTGGGSRGHLRVPLCILPKLCNGRITELTGWPLLAVT